MKDISSKLEKTNPSEAFEPTLSEKIQDVARKWAPAFRIMILLCIFIVAFFVRIFSVNKKKKKKISKKLKKTRLSDMKASFMSSTLGLIIELPNIWLVKGYMAYGIGLIPSPGIH